MSHPNWENVVYQFDTRPDENFTGVDDIADAYVVEMNDEAQGGLVVYGKYGGQWLANPSERLVIRRLLVDLRRIDPARGV